MTSDGGKEEDAIEGEDNVPRPRTNINVHSKLQENDDRAPYSASTSTASTGLSLENEVAGLPSQDAPTATTYTKMPPKEMEKIRKAVMERNYQRRQTGTKDNPTPTSDKKQIQLGITKCAYALMSRLGCLGVRHLLVIVITISYTLIGASIFYNIESPNEIQVVSQRKQKLEVEILALTEELAMKAKHDRGSLHAAIKNGYVKLLKTEDRYFASTYYKLEGEENRLWSFNSALFFCANIFTTAGYGVIYCSSTLGQILTIAYSIITIPLTFVVFRDLGQFILFYLTKHYVKVLIKIRDRRGIPTSDTEQINLPLQFAILAVFLYLLGAATFVHHYDLFWGPNCIDFLSAFYFSYLTMACIGLGDVMPVNATYSPIISTLFFFGMPFTRVLNRIAYLSIENGIFGMLSLFEQKREMQTRAQQPMPGIATIEEPKEENENENENMLTLTSIAAMVKERRDIYGGDFGRISITRQDI